MMDYSGVDSELDMAHGIRKGEEVYYTGDMANCEAWGKVVKIRHNTVWGTSFDILLDEGEPTEHLTRGIKINNFEGIGRRFILKSVYLKERAEKIAEMQEQLKRYKKA